MRKHNRLTDIDIRRKSKPGLYLDGAGLRLQVSPGGTKSWVFQFMLDGRSREMGLGPYPLVSLPMPAAAVTTPAELLLDGSDPIEHRNAERLEQAPGAG